MCLNSGTVADPFLHSSRYYYDTETGFYYLQSRYYDPGIGRFISADGAISGVGGELLGYNMFSYCFNNPVNLNDTEGTWPSWAKKLAIGVAVIAAAAILTVATGGAAAAASGLVVKVHCFAVGALKGSIIGGAVGAVTSGATAAVKHRLKTGSWKGAGKAARDAAADGFMWGTISGFITGGSTSNVCFVAGTAVLTATGTAAIETIQAGDMVWAWDEETGEVALKEVVETYVNETDELVHVFVNGEEIVTTPTHPFYSPVKGWTDAVKLRAGDILVMVNGEYVVVEMVQHEILEAPVPVYNFQVKDYHTYYVTDSCVLVHNTCATRRGHQRQREAKMMNGKSITALSGKTRVPDYLNQGNRVMGEAKSVRYLSLTRQLDDMFRYADANGYKMFLKIESWTVMSKPLQDAINTYNVAVNIF